VIGLRRVRLVTLLLACLLGVSAIPASPALAATECINETLAGITIQGNLTVPGGAFCVLDGSTVTGSVTVGQGVNFQAYGATIQGKVSGVGVYSVVLGDMVVKGRQRPVAAYLLERLT